jgi:hypothetical protein
MDLHSRSLHWLNYSSRPLEVGGSKRKLINKNQKKPLVLSGLLLCRFAARNLSDLTDRETWDGMNLAVLASTIGYILL